MKGSDQRAGLAADARAQWCARHGIAPRDPVAADRELAAPVIGFAVDSGTGDPAAAPAHYRHHPDDPVAITPSSSTTRMPASVVHSHHSLFAAQRVRAALGVVAAELPLRVVAVPASEIVLGPTGKVRKLLMRQRLLADASAT